MDALWLIIIVVFFAIFMQSAVGFGLALVAMPLLIPFFGLKLIAPLIALVGILAKVLLLIKYGYAFNFRFVWRMTLASLLCVPLGVYLLDIIDDWIALMVLGVVVIGYALYGLCDFKLPELQHPNWALGFGALAGILGGAYNASGPPLVIYADTQHWGPIKFKSNFQGYSLVNGLVIAITHAANGNMTADVLQAFWYAVPAVFLGVWLGIKMDRFFNPERFRRLILWLLIILGLRLIF